MEDLHEILAGGPLPAEAWPDRPVVIYGAGHCGREAAQILANQGRKVVAFVDENAWAIGSIDGIPCRIPDDPLVGDFARGGHPVLLGVFNFTLDPGALAVKLKALGFRKILSYYEFLEAHGPFPSEKYWFAPRSYFYENAGAILETESLWSDETSREIFLDAVRLRCRQDPSLLCDPDRERQYFPTTLPDLVQPVRLVDGGAYTGDTLEAMTSRGIRFGDLAAFEPEPANFRKLEKTVERLGLPSQHLFSSGLGEASRRERFQTGREAASGFSGEGDWMTMVSLDEALPDFSPTMIKLDIEGSEAAALRGAEEMIRKHRPRLAVCIYHKPADLWEIPRLIQTLTPGYRYYLRYHGYNGFDLVAYAVPESDF